MKTLELKRVGSVAGREFRRLESVDSGYFPMSVREIQAIPRLPDSDWVMAVIFALKASVGQMFAGIH
jgi:hypothetical protein